jgi:hypothetical protein
MIPSGYKEDTVFSAIPTDGSGDLSFTRASNGTRVNSAGLVEVTPWNLLNDSEDFAIQTKVGSTIGSNVTTAPNGTTTADSLIEDNSNGPHAVYNFTAINFVTGQYTFSAYIKKGSRDWVSFQLYDGANIPVIYANVNTGVLGDIASGATASIESVGNGWFRITISYSMNSASGGWAIYGATANGTNSYTGTNALTALYVWGAQLNIGAIAKPYFPTTDRLNVPRLTYQNGGGGCPSLLLEKQSTNLALYSEQFDDASWTKGDVTVTANSTTSPDGTTNADTINLGAGGFANIRQFIAVANDTSYTVSCYYKNIALTAGQTFEMRYTNELSAPNNFNAITTIDLFNGTVTSQVFGTIGTGYSGSVSSSITNVGNGWYRVTMTFTVGSSGGANGIFRPAVIPTGQARTFYAWGAQLELGAYPTSYIPTTSASATRVADACFKTGISSLIGQTEGTVFVDVSGPSKTGDARYISVSNSTDTNRILLYATSLTTIGAYFQNPTAGAIQPTFNAVNGRMKIAIGYKNNDLAVYMNGTLQGTVSSYATAFTFNFVGVGTYEDGTIANSLDQSINEAVIFKTRLTNAELASLTTI